MALVWANYLLVDGLLAASIRTFVSRIWTVTYPSNFIVFASTSLLIAT